MEQHIKHNKITNTPILPTAAILGAVFLWGSSFSTMRMALNDLNPMATMFLRLFIGSVCLLPFIGRLVPENYQKGDWKILSAMVVCQPCLYFLFESQALIHTTSSQAGIISACLPLLVAFAAFIFLSESIGTRTIVGLLLSIVGVVLLTLFQARSAIAPNPILGNCLEVAAMVAACGYTIIVKKLSTRYNPWTLTGMQLIAGTLFFLPGLKFILAADQAIWDIKLVSLLLFLGAFVSLMAFGLYNYGISKIQASRASIYINLIPVIAIILGWIFLGESLNIKQGIAALIVIIGVTLSTQAKA